VDTEAAPTDMSTDPLQTFYPPPAQQNVSLAVNQKAVAAYVAGLAQQVDRAPTDAQLAFTDGKVQVSKPAQTGVQLNQQRAIEQIANALQNGSSGRSLTLQTSVKQADVREDNLAALGINERISEGVTYFPGSTSSRLVNVRVGQAKYNGVLLKPGQTFSFGEILGDVGPAQGYVPELVILGNHEEKQYGGGLCQVASTAFRAALLAGLPIAERYNHSFAVGYYTAPFGVPGVDATIYYPQVDFKFVNDTGHYILIQTHMEGTTLTFDYYGTKTKTGEIRGPQFITGTNDAKQASHTVFYEDIKDLSGNVTKSVRFDSYYQPSTNFPIEQQKTGA
jgi:vancomycin resistance protein YoaR